jgi:hypothetical protein
MFRFFRNVVFVLLVVFPLFADDCNMRLPRLFQQEGDCFVSEARRDLAMTSKFSNDMDSEYHIRKFAMLNHSEIAMDANEEAGEYMIALADLMSEKMERSEAIVVIKRALEISEGDQLSFGNELISSFRERENTEKPPPTPS